MVKITLDGDFGNISFTVRNEDAARTYRFDVSVSNLVDQLSLLSGKTKSDVVADSIRLAALFSKIAGYNAMKTIADCNDLGDILNLLKSCI